MKIKPKDDYSLITSEISLDKNKVYEAFPATNIPNWKERGLVFCEEILLCREEYEIVEA